MAYNISSWTTKKIDGLVIPLAALYDISDDLKSRGWLPGMAGITKVELGDIHVHIPCTESSFVKGILRDGNVHVSELLFAGEASGTFFYEVAAPAIRQGFGYLEAIAIWEGGDSITRIIVNNGEIEEKRVRAIEV